MRGRRGAGFSVVEALLSMALMLTLAALSFRLLGPAQGIFATQSEVADMQQRARAAFDALHRDLAEAGAGSTRGRTGPLAFAFPAVLPMRLGPRAGDPPGTVKSDTVTVLYVAARAAQATIDQPMLARTDAATIRLEPGCPLGDPACGFREGMDVLLHDGTGAFDIFSVVGVVAPTLALQHTLGDWSHVYPIGSTLIQIESRTYYSRGAQPTRPPQLVRYAGGTAPDVPVVDHVVGLAFDYLGDPAPPTQQRPLTEPHGPWTSYGPPPPIDPASVPPVPSSSCLYLANGTPMASPRLPPLGPAGGPLVPLVPAQLGDGPFCPDDLASSRFDADLLRIRSIGVTVRVQAANAALRGPASTLFAQAGTARIGDRYAPDLELRFRVTPRNLELGR